MIIYLNIYNILLEQNSIVINKWIVITLLLLIIFLNSMSQSRTILHIALFAMLFGQIIGFNITIQNSTNSIPVTNTDGSLLPEFISTNPRLSCIMPKLLIYNDSAHEQYKIKSEGVILQNVAGKYHPINPTIQCNQNQADLPVCVAVLSNHCTRDGKDQLNWVIVELGQPVHQNFQYLVNCNPESFYKPFQWGLFLLICFCTITITASSMYSRAWSYKGFGINITKTFIIVFNIFVIVGSILAYLIPNVTGVILKILGSIIGTIGVAVCTSETLWLTKSNFLILPRVRSVRMLDVISMLVGIFAITLYWVTNGMWIINDILAISTIIAGIKIFKVRSLKTGVFMLFALLIIQIIAGLIVHYALKVSYNNLVIQMFQSPLVVVAPSITPQFYRKCAWIPVTNIIFPGLFISYLRRFDQSRGTFLYLIIGYGSFYIGSILWMIVDMSTRHALPMAIISDPVTVVIICFFAIRRNQLKTIWNGLFYDSEMPDVSQNILPSDRSSGDNYIAFQQITQNLKIDRNKDNSQTGQI